MPRDEDRAAHGHPHGRGLFRRRQGRAARRSGRRGGRHRAGAGGAVLSGDREDHRCLQGDRRRSGSPGLRIPLGARGFRRGACQRRDRVHRAERGGDCGDGRQDRVQEIRRQSQGLDRPRFPRHHRGREARAEDRRGNRLSGDDQGLGRRRRQGHAGRPQQSRGCRELHARALRGQGELRRRSGVPREIHRKSAPRRSADPRRQARQPHPSRRARVLDPAAKSESGRGSAVAAAR